MQLWWVFWLAAANIGATGLVTPSITTNLLAVLLSLTTICGYVLMHYFPREYKLIRYGGDDNSFLNKLHKINKFIFNAILIVDGFYCYKAIKIFIDEGIIGYRIKTFSTYNTPSILYGSAQVELTHLIIIEPLSLFFMISSITLYLYKADIKYLYCAFLIAFIQSIIVMGRFNLYTLVVLTIYGGYVYGKKFKIKLLFLSLLIISIILVGVSTLRDNYEGKNVLVEIASSSVYDYHVIGFLLFDKAINDKNSFINNEITYGRAVFGGIDRAVTLLISRFDKSFELGLKNTGADRQDRIDVSNQRNEIREYNAHYTIMYLLYSDGGVIGIMFFGMFYGIISAFILKKYYYSNSPKYFLAIMLLFNASFLAIFTSPLESVGYWGCVFITYLTSKKIKMFRSQQPHDNLFAQVS